MPGNHRDETILTHAGNHPRDHFGIINPPLYRASTVLFNSLEHLRASDKDVYASVHYGLFGTPTTFAFEEAMAKLEGADKAIAVPSGLAAVTASLLAFTEPGDHILVVDSCYGPTRGFCDSFLKRYNVTTQYYDPTIGGGIIDLIKPNTKLIFLESPGSNTFEIQDLPAITKVSQQHGIITIIDNTWATPLFLKPFDHGIDVSLHAGTKYIAGHADIMIGVINTKANHFRRLKNLVHGLGMCVSPEDCYLALRGLRTMAARLRIHERQALEVAQWLKMRPEVKRVLHPALQDDPGHALFKRDFQGSAGLFAFELHPPVSDGQLAAMIDHMELFGLGYSWGGYESLIMPIHDDRVRRSTPPLFTGPAIRLHIGLEHTADLIADLSAGFERMARAA